MDPARPKPPRRWPLRLVAIVWPLALAGAVALSIVESRTDSPDARADRGRPASPRSATLPRLVEPPKAAHHKKPKRVKVPSVTGFRARAAERALARRHLGILPFGRESLLPAGTVLDQSPRPGKRVRRGTEVRVHLAIDVSGRMPRVLGFNVAHAAADLWAVGLEVKFAYRGVDAPERDGEVIAQSPPTGAKVHDGDVVWLQVARR